jgi:hypothetical protein
MVSERRRWWVAFGLLAAAGLAWVLATPIFAAPDEPFHVIRAASAGRGELLGTPTPKGETPIEFGNAAVDVTAPGAYSNASEVACFAFRPNRTADCYEVADRERTTTMITYVGHHPPAYYATIGFLTRWMDAGETQVYLMRGLGMLAIAALVASAVVSLGRLLAPAWAGVGLAVTLSPMALFLASTVSPSGIEVGAAIAVWVSGAVLVVDRSAVGTRVVDRLGIAALVLVLTRALSPLWLAVIAVALLLLVDREHLMAIVRDRRMHIWAGVFGLGVVIQAWWFLYADPFGHFVGTPVDMSAVELVRTSFGKTARVLSEMVGYFGWLDTKSPAFTLMTWGLAFGALVGLALAFASARFVRAIVLVAVATLGLPVLIESLGAGQAGFIWQGRYSMPLAVGLPLLAGIAIGTVPVLRETGRRFLWIVAGALTLAQAAAFTQALRRYSVGARGELWFFADARWDPPVPSLLLVVVYSLVVAALTWWIVVAPAAARRGEDERVEAAA